MWKGRKGRVTDIMNKQSAKTHTYCLEVSNFGPIVEANVEMRPLTVFVGPSNTGKSYLAILLYALHRALQGSRERLGGHVFTGGTFFEWKPIPTISTPNRDLQSAVEKWVNVSKMGGKIISIPDILRNSVKNTLQERVDGLESQVVSELCRCFGTDISRDLIRRPSKAFHVGLSIPSSICTENVRINLQIGRKTVRLSGDISDSLIDSAIKNLASNSDFFDDLQSHFRHQVALDSPTDAIWWLTKQIGSLVFDRTIDRDTYYLPADRTGIMHAHHALVSALIQRAARTSIHHSVAVPLLSGVVADFLDKLIGIGKFNRPRPRKEEALIELAKRLEIDVLGGQVQLNLSDSGYPLFNYQPKGWKSHLPLMRSSSMVSEIAPVVLFLQHLVFPGDILIIEEPESHLHPEMQAAFARQLARLVQAGIRVVVTTHSEWLLDQFANLVQLSNLPESKRKELSGGPEALHPDQFGAWLFKPKNRPKGSVVEETRVSAEAGGLVTDFADTADRLYNTWAEAGNLIKENKVNSK